MIPQPTFQCKDRVTVIAYDLDAPGRVSECVWTGDEWHYGVEFAINGDIRSARFYEDEIRLEG